MKIFYTEEAKQNIREVFDYIACDSYDNAVAVRKRMKEAVDRLKDFPDIGFYPKHKKLKARGYRFLVSDNYLIFHKIKGDTIIIIAVIHGSREYSKLL